MEEKALKFAACVIGALTLVMGAALPFFPKFRTRLVDAKEERQAQAEYERQQQGKMQELEILDELPQGQEDARQLKLRLPEDVDGGRITVVNDYVTQCVRIEVPGADNAYFDSYPIVGSSNHIDRLSYTMGNGGVSGSAGAGVIEIVLDRVYELDMDYDDEFYYFDFLTPKEVYDKVVVIDAGHGGRAPGATKQGVMEKEIDLAITLELREIFQERGDNIGVYYTRTDDSNPTFDQRVQLANLSGADLFVSIHNNSLGNGRMSDTNGTQVMYDESLEQSLKFARICLEEVTASTGSKNRGLIEGDSIYILRNSDVPAALIEVGFMTNQRELELLQTKEYQRKTAEGIYRAIRRALKEI